MAYDVARVRGLHPSLGDGWVHFDAPSGMLIPDSVGNHRLDGLPGLIPPAPPARIRRQAQCGRARSGPSCGGGSGQCRPPWRGAGRRPRGFAASLADASSTRSGLGYEMIVTRLDDEANIAPWLRASNRFGAKVKWAEVDIENR